MWHSQFISFNLEDNELFTVPSQYIMDADGQAKQGADA